MTAIKHQLEPLVRLSLRDQFDEAYRQVCEHPVLLNLARTHLQAIVVGTDSVENLQTDRHKLADKRQAEMQKFYNGLGFDMAVPRPNVSNRAYRKHRAMGQELFFPFASAIISYDAFMCAVGQNKHWTVTHADREKIVWEPTAEGYWFWAEVAPTCPHLGTTWDDLSRSIHQLSLEEYVIVWHAHKALTGTMLDLSTWCWLRTRFQTDSGSSALSAGGCGGGVGVDGWCPEGLGLSDPGCGGRCAEVVKSAA